MAGRPHSEVIAVVLLLLHGREGERERVCVGEGEIVSLVGVNGS